MAARWQVLLFAVGLFACSEESAPPSGAPDKPTYYEHVAPILAERCNACHADGGIGPMRLDTFELARDAAASIKAATQSGSMPPFHVNASGDCNDYKNARVLDEAELETLARWADQGAPEGDASLGNPSPKTPPTLGEVSLTLDPGVEYEPNASVDDDYRCFVIDPGVTSDVFVTGYDVHPGVRSEVHHVVVYSTDNAGEAAAARSLDDAEAGPGYTCFGGPGTGGGRTLAAWAPGTGATLYPAKTGLRLIANQPVVVQVHYNQATLPDRTTIDLQTATSVPKEAIITATFNLGLELSPGQENVETTVVQPFGALGLPYKIHGVYPHMHTYGRTMRVDVVQGGAETCLVDVPDYAFGWQEFYWYDEPVVLDAVLPGAYEMRCGYDTRGAKSTIRWGEGTGDEMCIAAFYVTL